MKTVTPISTRGFTLIELLLVIGLLAVLATAVVLVINPTQLLAQARDSRRLTELSDLNKAIQIANIGGISLGTTMTVYVSIPDASSSICASLGLPILPGGWSYACSSPANYRKVNGTGWLPINFPSLAVGSPLGVLPIDPVNTISSGLYYTYVTGGSWELTTILESDKYADKAINDGDAYSGVYSLRSSQNPLTPGIRDKGLVGYWKFDEGIGTSAADSSGNGNNGTLNGGAIWTSGQVNGALSFDGVDDYVNVSDSSNFKFGTGNFTLSVWIKSSSSSTIVALGKYSGSGNDYWLGFLSGKATFSISGGTLSEPTVTANDGNWHLITEIKNSGLIYIFVDGVQRNSGSNNNGASPDGYLGIGKFGSGATFYWNGAIDDVRIYNRALSATEIAAIYNATK